MLNTILKPRLLKSSETMPARRSPAVGAGGNRRGSAILIVISLLFTLFLLGTFFARFVSTELSSAQWFAKDAKEVDPADGSDVYFDWALEQVIIGPRGNQAQSALYGLKHGLVPGVVGSLNGSQQLIDAHVNSGRGVRISFPDGDNDGVPDDASVFFDYNHDGTNEPLVLNFSPAANDGTSPLFTNPEYNYEPDAGYTYPDINNLALAHLSYIPIYDPNTGERNMRPVWIPSFHRPQYLVNWRRSANQAERRTNNPWTDPATRNQVLRPHVGHVTPLLDGSSGNGPRFNATDFPGLDSNDVGPDEGIWTITRQSDGTERLPLALDTLFSDVDYEYDIDADGDGVKEAIFLDLDFPVSDNDGQLFIPIFGVTILDADALLNVNVHGNPHYFNGFMAEQAALMGTGFNGSLSDILRLNRVESYSQSGSGLSPFEVNITRGFYADPRMMESDGVTPWFGGTGALDSQLEQYQGMFNFNVSSYTAPLALDTNDGGVRVGLAPVAGHGAGGPGELSNVQIANLEMARLIYGSLTYSGGAIDTGGDVIPGRYGDQTELELFRGSSPTTGFPRPGTANFPAPGIINQDDDSDALLSAGQGYRDPVLANLIVPPSFHPVDVIGMGGGALDPTDLSGDPTNYVAQPTYSPSGRLSSDGSLLNDTNNPSRWPAYGPFWFNHDALGATTRREYNELPGPDAAMIAQNPLMPDQRTYWLTDEPDELIVDPELSEVEGDQIYPASEMMGLHLKGTDYVDVSASSRLRTLLPFNFDSNDESRFIREQFTTSSWDRMEFSFSPFVDASTRGWEFEIQPTTKFGRRRAFPPAFGGGGANSNDDPFRWPTRHILSVEIDRPISRETETFFPKRRRLLFNKIVDSRNPTQPGLARAEDEDVQFRNLVPHPVFVPGDTPAAIDPMWHGNGRPDNTTNPQFYGNITANKHVQEWWARYDRQRLARDIYVLLYTLSFGNDGFDVTAVPPNTEQEAMARQMAQFAVNVVDANDSDSVITRFEYDSNLSDGWDAPSNVVYGVEAQELTFSEVKWLVCKHNMNVDQTATIFDDRDIDKQFLFVELRNATPKDIQLASGTYRILRVGTNPMTDPDQYVTMATGTGGTVNTVRAGANFLIGTHGGEVTVSGGADDGTPRAAVLRMKMGLDDNSGFRPEFEPIIPFRENAYLPTTIDDYDSSNTTPLCDLDLCHERDINEQDFEEFGDPAGYLLPSPDGNGDIGPTEIELVLQRQLNTNSAGRITNPIWVEVDRVEVPVSILDLGDTDRTSSQIYNNDAATGAWESGGGVTIQMRSYERAQPLFQDSTSPTPLQLEVYNGSNPIYQHTLGSPNPNNGNGLFSVQRITADDDRFNQGNSNSPSEFTLWQPHFDRPFSSVFDVLSVPVYGPDEVVTDLAPGGALSDANVAGSRFLNPDNPVDANVDNDNRWYRILEFFEVDPQVHESVRNELATARTPGKINLNTIRNTGPFGYLSSLSALIDDDQYTHSFNLRDRLESGRHWGEQFLLTRDGIDPVWRDHVTAFPPTIPLPGTSASKPFRPLGYFDNSNATAGSANRSIEHTILRRLPVDTRRHLFEAQTATEANTDAIDFHSRHRLLRKIANNSTTKSHVFIVWIGVQFHKVDDTNGFYEVGEQLTYNSSNPTAPDNDPRFTPRRGFFVVDRSLLEQAYDPNSQKFDFRKFVVFRKTISEP